MIIICIVALIIYVFLLKSEVPLIRLFKRQDVSVKRMYLNDAKYLDSKYQMLVLFIITVLIVLMGLMFHLPFNYIMILLIFSFLTYPIFMIWLMQHHYHSQEFEQLTAFLQHFLAHFKTNHKVLLSLIESRQYVKGNLLKLVDEAIASLKESGDASSAFQLIASAYPHFIVYNLQTWIASAEVYGVEDCLDAIELLEDDIDDWIEDTHLNIMGLHQMKNKILTLCGISLVIALFNQVMLQSVLDLDMNVIYNNVILMFLLINLGTILMVYRFLKASWILKGECLWKN